MDGTRLAIRHDERPTTDSGEGIERSEQRGGGIVDPGRVDERQARADQRHAALAGPVDDAADQLGVARPDDEMGANGDDRHRVVRGRKDSPLRHCLGHRVVTMGPLRVGRRSTVATDRRTVMGDRRARDVHEPRHARSTSGRVHRDGALDVDRLEIGPVADRIDLRREVDHPVDPCHRGVDNVGIGDRAEVLDHPIKTAGRALQHDDVVAGVEQPGDRVTAEQAGGAGDEHPHGLRTDPPSSTPVAQSARWVRSILELWRRSTGSDATSRHAATSRPVASVTAARIRSMRSSEL